jgi:hypothetical protein
MPRFVVLFHRVPAGARDDHCDLIARGDHWDLMFESRDALRTWAIVAAPRVGQTSVALSLADHRLEYLEYEGPVSGDRGDVARWDSGRYELIAQTEAAWQARLEGNRFTGEVRLQRLDDQRWSVSFTESSDAAAGGTDCPASGAAGVVAAGGPASGPGGDPASDAAGDLSESLNRNVSPEDSRSAPGGDSRP